MKRAVVLTYDSDSKGAKSLTSHLDGRMIRHREILRDNECLINWGSGHSSGQGWKSEWLNKPAAVCRAVDKLEAFWCFAHDWVPHPLWTRDVDDVRSWLQSGYTVLSRATSSGMMGQGISILNTPSASIPSAEFYAKHVQHSEEYRVHVFKELVCNLGRKVALRPGANMMVRNADEHNWDFEYVSTAPFPVLQAGLKAVMSLGLDFGAADVGYRQRDNTAWVFEVNSAPGVGHYTITKYAEVMLSYLRSL